MVRSHPRTAVLTALATVAGLVLVGTPAASAAPAAAPDITSGDHYRITGGSSGLAIDVESSSTAGNARVVQREVDLESTSQAWRALQQSDGYQFRNANSGKCLSVSEGEDAGAHLVQRECDGSAGQLWRVRAGDVDPTAGFQSVLNGYYIDVPGTTQTEDTWLELQPGNADGGAPGASQSFYVVRVDV